MVSGGHTGDKGCQPLSESGNAPKRQKRTLSVFPGSVYQGMKGAKSIRPLLDLEHPAYFLFDLQGADGTFGGIIVRRHTWIPQEFEDMLFVPDQVGQAQLVAGQPHIETGTVPVRHRHIAGEAVRKVFVHGIFSTGRIWEYVCGHLVLENPHPMRSAVRILPHLVRSNDGGGFHTPQDLPICGRWAFLHTVQYVAYGWLGSIP